MYWSRSRKKLWHKGEESGHVQKVLEIRLDCDEDVVLLKVEQAGGIACHTGRHSCFFQKFEATQRRLARVEPVLKDPDTIYTKPKKKHMSATLDRLAAVIESRKPDNGGDPDTSYVARLFAKGDDAILKKIGEEATETVMAAKDARVGGDASKVLYEVRRPVVPFDGAAGAVRPDAAAGARRAGAPRRRVRHRRKSRAQDARIKPAHRRYTMDNCTFCKIAAKQIPSSVVYEDDELARLQGHQPGRAGAPAGDSRSSTWPPCPTARERTRRLLGKMLALAPKLAAEHGCAVTHDADGKPQRRLQDPDQQRAGRRPGGVPPAPARVSADRVRGAASD